MDCYYCDRHEIVIQIGVDTNAKSPDCPICGAVMTFGRFSENEPVYTPEEACASLLWAGMDVAIRKDQVPAIRAYMQWTRPRVKYTVGLPDPNGFVKLTSLESTIAL